MLIVCPNCSRSYLVRATDLIKIDRLVKCSACHASWRPEEAENTVENIDEIPIKRGDTVHPLKNQNDHSIKRKPSWRIVTLGATAAALTGLAVLTLNGRAETIFSRAISWIDAVIPGRGLQGISFANIKTSIGTELGETSLLIEGEIRSDSEISKKLPEIQFTMRDKAENTIF
jgi:predicted Zn finger-like uncharacterized protein